MESAFGIIAEPNRRAILSLLATSERSVSELEHTLRMSQPSVSKHLGVLRKAGFVESRVDAQRRVYRIKPEPFMEVDAWLDSFRRFWSGHVDALERHLDRMEKLPPQKEEEAMNNREQYAPGAAFGADIQKHGDTWTLVLVRTLRHPPAKVWEALTDPAQLREWAPYDADRNLGTPGTARLSTVGAPAPHITEGTVKRAESERLLEFDWGGNEMRWELEPLATGTRLTLWHNINRKFIAMGAAGWHICFDVLDHLLDGHAIGRIAGGDAMKFDGWQRLHAEYAKQFAVETPDSGSDAASSRSV